MSYLIRPNEYGLGYQIGKTFVPSRFFLAPINTGFAECGNPTIQAAEFHRQRSGRGIGISYIGNVAIAPEFVTNKNTLYQGIEKNSWRSLSTLIENNGSIPGIQLGCRFSRSQPVRGWDPVDPDGYVTSIRSEIDEISADKIEDIIGLFIRSAEMAYANGFRAVQIHAAHGYFLSLMISKVLNDRKDAFGKNRLLILERIVNGIKERLPDALLDVRVSLYEGLNPPQLELDDKYETLLCISKLPVDIISLSNGLYDFSKRLIYPSESVGHAAFVPIASKLAQKMPTKIWNVCGNIWDISELARSIPPNLSYSIGRALIADPELIMKFQEGRSDEVRRCLRCDRCHYYSRGETSLACAVNKDLGAVVA